MTMHTGMLCSLQFQGQSMLLAMPVYRSGQAKGAVLVLEP